MFIYSHTFDIESEDGERKNWKWIHYIYISIVCHLHQNHLNPVFSFLCLALLCSAPSCWFRSDEEHCWKMNYVFSLPSVNQLPIDNAGRREEKNVLIIENYKLNSMRMTRVLVHLVDVVAPESDCGCFRSLSLTMMDTRNNGQWPSSCNYYNLIVTLLPATAILEDFHLTLRERGAARAVTVGRHALDISWLLFIDATHITPSNGVRINVHYVVTWLINWFDNNFRSLRPADMVDDVTLSKKTLFSIRQLLSIRTISTVTSERERENELTHQLSVRIT